MITSYQGSLFHQVHSCMIIIGIHQFNCNKINKINFIVIWLVVLISYSFYNMFLKSMFADLNMFNLENKLKYNKVKDTL